MSMGVRSVSNKNDVPTEFLIFRPGTENIETIKVILPQQPGFNILDAVVRPMIGASCRNLEHVSVLYKSKPHDMFVDDEGALSIKGRIALQRNEAATAIYHAYSKSRGLDMSQAPHIHGVAVIATRKVWF